MTKNRLSGDGHCASGSPAPKGSANTRGGWVPYGAGEEIIAALGSEKAAHDMGYLLDLTRQAKPYTVALFSYQQKALEEKGAMYTVCDGTFYVLQPEYYHDQVGLTMEGTSCDILIL